MQEVKTPKIQPSWHHISVDLTLGELDADPAAGLSQHEAEARLKTHGHNQLPEPPKRSATIRFLLQFHNILIYVLLGSAVITAALDHWIDTFVILAVVLANAIIGLKQ